MQLAKWGNSLAIRLPSAIVEGLQLKAGDELDIRIGEDQNLILNRSDARSQALARLKRLRRPLPKGFAFDRDDANAR